MNYWRRELLHTLAAIAVTVIVAVAIEVSTTETFDKAFLIGMAVTAARTLGTAVVIVLSPLALKSPPAKR